MAATVSAPLLTPPPASLQAVVSFTGVLPDLRGIEVRTVLPAVHAAVVRGDAYALRALSAAPGVRGVSPDDRMELSGRPGLGSGSFASDGLDDGAGRPGGGAGVRVAVVDTGVSDSAALNRASGRLVDAVDTRGVRRGSAPRTRGVFDDGHGHGTFMASIVAGGPVEGSGGRAVGVAPGATVLVVRVADEDGSTSLSQVVAGLNWVASHPRQVDVASLSLGRERPRNVYGEDPLTGAVAAVQNAGVPVVVAAGNEAGVVSDPGFLPPVITVGAADVNSRTVVAASGSGVVAGVSKPDLVANGVSVFGVVPDGSVVAREHPASRLTGDLWRGSGTSQATAVVSGATALLLARYPGATPAQVKATLREGAQPLGDVRAGQGLLDIGKKLVGTPEGTTRSGTDLTGLADFDARQWAASSWCATSWLANGWSSNGWSSNGWSANSWSANSWSANSWSANSWSGGSWAANSWSANSWSANSWSANSWSANSWSANSWSANSWSASSWSSTWDDPSPSDDATASNQGADS